MKEMPLEFIIEKEENEEELYKTTYFYEDGSKDETYSHSLPKGLRLKKHYFIGGLFDSYENKENS